MRTPRERWMSRSKWTTSALLARTRGAEVRRFIPKNTILRDPNLDFASDFSVTTNRLEPMARFRSHLLTDKLDLRVLEGLSTRRYRSLVSYQLSDAFSGQLQLDNEHATTGTDFGFDFKLRWEGE